MRLHFFSLIIVFMANVSQAETNSICQYISRLLTGSTEIYTPNMSDVHSISKKVIEEERHHKESVDSTSEKISGLVGRCVLDPPDRISESSLHGPMNYDSLVLPFMTGLKKLTPKSEKSNGTPDEAPLFLQARDLNIPGLNPQSFMEIDSFARTIYAEMAVCAPIGNEYLNAVARVIKNRAASVETKRDEIMTKYPDANHKRLLNAGKEFINDEDRHWPGKNLVTKVSSSPVQFTAWNSYMIDFDALNEARGAEVKKLSKRMSLAKARKKAEEIIRPDAKSHRFYKFNESGLLQTLCPPSSKTKKFYTGNKPSEALQAVWKSIVKVAVEATLYPEQFNARTSQLAKVLNYTSARKTFYDFEQVHPKIDGRKIDNERCLNLWVDTKK